MEIKFNKLEDGAVLPTRAHDGDAGLDLYALEKFRLGPEERIPVRTGISVEIPEGHAGLVLPRSGLARHDGISLVNSPGLIDSGYRGEILVLMLNNDPADTFLAEAGDRIAQLVIVPVVIADPVEAGSLAESDRAEGGFGSSGA